MAAAQGLVYDQCPCLDGASIQHQNRHWLERHSYHMHLANAHKSEHNSRWWPGVCDPMPRRWVYCPSRTAAKGLPQCVVWQRNNARRGAILGHITKSQTRPLQEFCRISIEPSESPLRCTTWLSACQLYRGCSFSRRLFCWTGFAMGKGLWSFWIWMLSIRTRPNLFSCRPPWYQLVTVGLSSSQWMTLKAYNTWVGIVIRSNPCRVSFPNCQAVLWQRKLLFVGAVALACLIPAGREWRPHTTV